MICKSCNLREICKTYDFIKDIDHAEIEITTCKYNTDISDFIKTLEPIKHVEEDTRTNNPNYKGQARQDLRDIEKKINNEPEKPDPIKVTCESCQGITYDDDIHICPKCGKPVCSNCGTAVNKQLLCKECWDKE